MANIVSATVIPVTTDGGSRYKQGYFLVEFRDARYTPGGENIPLDAWMRNIDYIQATPISGNNTYNPRPNMGDYPGNAGSGRIELYYLTSMIATLNISGLPIQVLSGAPNLGALGASGGIAASGLLGPLSGRLGLTGSGVINAGITQFEILSGTAVSGTRALLHVLGY